MKPCPSCSAPVRHDATFCTTCGHKLEAASSAGLAPGAVVDGKYRIERILGEGGMGVVYLAREIHTDIHVVIKAVRPEIGHRQDIRQRVLAEGKALAHIDHANVVSLKSVVVTERDLLLVMQYVEGESLEARIARLRDEGRTMPLADALRIFRQVLAGVGAAHDEGVIHRDIKPGNILIRAKDGAVKVTDFGIAKPEEDPREGSRLTKGIIGSVHYMSPEQVTGQQNLDRRSDIYALGVLLFEMLTGQVPYDADSTFEILRKHVEDAFPSASAGRPHLPPMLDVMFARACAKSRDERYKTCKEFEASLVGAEDLPTGSGMTMGAGRTIPEAPIVAFDPNSPASQFVSAVSQAHVSSQQRVVSQAVPQYPQAPYPQAPYPQAPYPQAPAHPVTAPSPVYSPYPPYATGPMHAVPPMGMHAMGSTTGQATELPAHRPRQGSGAGWIFAVVAGVLVVGAISIPIIAGWGPFGSKPEDDTSSGTSSDDQGDKKKKKKSVPTAEPSNSAVVTPESALAALQGSWASERGNPFNAVMVGDRLEFQIVNEGDFRAQGYRAGEARFVLRALEGETTTFAVEDRVRPIPPHGLSYNGENAPTCLGVWREAGGQPLRATLNADRLDVTAAKIEPTAANFDVVGAQVVSCRGLEKLSAAPLPVVLLRR